MNTNQQQDISNWILAHTQLCESLEDAWQEVCQSRIPEEEDEDALRLQTLEKEKIISQIVQEVWKLKIEEKKKSNNAKKQLFEGECTSYNIHQVKNPQLGLKDVTLWRLSLKECKLDNSTFHKGVVELNALEYNIKDSKKRPRNKK